MFVLFFPFTFSCPDYEENYFKDFNGFIWNPDINKNLNIVDIIKAGFHRPETTQERV